MRLSEFAGVTLPSTQSVNNITRQALDAVMRPTGAPQGDYDLYGSSSPFASQAYDIEFVYTAASQTTIDALIAKVGVRGTLKQTLWDGSTTRQTEAKLLSAELTSDVDDKHMGIQRVACKFRAEPYWYAITATTVTFTNATSIPLAGTSGNVGNARAIKYVVLTVTSTLGTAATFSLTPAAGTVSALSYISTTTAALKIDAGAHTVLDGSTNVYANISRAATQIPLLFLEPGNSTLGISTAASGNITFRSTYK